jgi:hypothetical protein
MWYENVTVVNNLRMFVVLGQKITLKLFVYRAPINYFSVN